MIVVMVIVIVVIMVMVMDDYGDGGDWDDNGECGDSDGVYYDSEEWW